MRIDAGIDANVTAVPQLVNRLDSTATLLLFAPRRIMDYVNRPLTYNLGTAFNDALVQLTTQRLRSPITTGQGAYYLGSDPEAAASILPSNTGTLVNTSTYSTDWTFVLIIDTPSFNLVDKNRRLYSGIALNCDCTVNGNISPETILNFTKLSSIECDNTVAGERIYGQGDWDIVNLQARQAIDCGDKGVYDLHPAAVASSLAATDPINGQLSMFSTYDNSFANTSNAASVKVNGTDINGSAQHLCALTSAIVNSVNVANYDTEDSPIIDGPGVVATHVQGTLGSQRKLVNPKLTGAGAVIDPTKPYSLSEIDRMFNGTLQVTIINQPFDNGVDKDVNTYAISRRNTFTNLLADSIIEVLVRFGLGSVAFTYQSATHADGYWSAPLGGDTSRVEVHHISDIVGCSDTTVGLAWNKAYSYLHDRIFPIIKQAAGDDFRVDVNASLFASTFICLNFLSEGVYDPTFTEINNVLGGLNSAVVGNSDVYANNVAQLNNTIQNVCDATGVGATGPDSVFSDLPF